MFAMTKSRWLAGLALSLVFLAGAYAAPDLIAEYIIGPRANDHQSGWRVRFSAPRVSGIKAHYRDVVPARNQNPLPPNYGACSAFAVWRAPETGHYRLKLAVAGEGSLAVDGLPVVVLDQLDPPADHLADQPVDQLGGSEQEGEGWMHLTAGPHVLRIRLRSNSPAGSFSAAVIKPPLMRHRILQGDAVARIEMGSLETWWYLMTAAHYLRPVAISGVLICSLALLLPLTLLNRRRSVTVLAGIILVPALALSPMESQEPYLGPMVHRELAAKSPEFVFIGNSMLWSRIDDDHLTALLGGRPVHSIVNFGGLSGIHYLAFKYLLADSGIKPKRTFIFFRSTTLVNPQARTRGPYFNKLIRRISPGPDPVFQKIAYRQTTSPKIRIADWLEQRFPVMRSQAFVREQLSRGAAVLALPLGRAAADDLTAVKLRETVNARLGFGGLNAGADNGLDVEAEGLKDNTNFLDFDGLVADSFLPAIIDLAAAQNLPLAFIRVQERPTAQGMPPDTQEMKQFLAALQGYLKQQGAAFYDFTGDPAITLDMYALGDHIRDPKVYTEIFHQRVGHLLQ